MPVPANLERLAVTGSTLADVQRAVNEALGTQAATDDLNQDAAVNVVDLQILINAALNLGCTAH